MTARLRAYWTSCSARERLFVGLAALVAGVMMYSLLVYSAEGARARLNKSVTELRAQARQLEQQASEVERLRPLPRPSASQRELHAVIDAETRAAGLSQALVRVETRGPDEVQVVLGSIAFSDWLAWVERLQSQQIRLDACRIEALSIPGLVSATATFVRAR